jgi:hypothetical protein
MQVEGRMHRTLGVFRSRLGNPWCRGRGSRRHGGAPHVGPIGRPRNRTDRAPPLSFFGLPLLFLTLQPY